jgi:hypothetical protein
LVTMTAPTVRIDPLVPDKGQAEDDDNDIFYDTRSEVSIGDIEADYDDDGEQFDEEGANDIDFKESVMMEYCSAIQKQLQLEFKKKQGKQAIRTFLRQELQRNNYVLPRHRAQYYCRQLNLKFHEIGYYHDINVWLPHEQWGETFMPPCKNCKCARNVCQHSWPKHPARRVFTATGCYYVMTRRFACNACIEDAKSVDVKSEKPSQTFMGWDSDSLAHMAYGRGERFPAILSRKSAVDKDVLNLLRAVMNRGVRPETFSDILKELHSIKYFGEMIDREYRLASGEAKNNGETSACRGSLFSHFSDRKKYNGAIPTGRYFQQVFVNFSKGIGDFMSNEAKKWPVTGLCVDTTYYITKILAKYHGAKMYDGLYSGTSTNLGHIRIQSYVNGESHDECRPLLESFVESQQIFGHPLPRIVVSDMPGRDESLIHEMIPSVKEYQEELDKLAALQAEDQRTEPTILPELVALPTPTLSQAEQDSQIKITITETDTINFATALLATMDERESTMSLDTECKTTRNASGMINWSGLPEVLQIGYDNDGTKMAWLIHLKKIPKLPPVLKILLESPNFKFVGVNVGADVKALEKKFKTPLEVNTVSLGVMARDRNVVTDGRVGMQELARVVLHEHMIKDPNVRCSDWSLADLQSTGAFSTSQRVYAAFDVIKPLEIYDIMNAMPDLNARLAWSDAKVGMEVDIFPSTGSVAAVSVSAIGVIKSITPGDNWIVPAGISANQNQRKISSKEQTVIVTLKQVFAAGLKVPYFTRGAEKRGLTLGALAEVHDEEFAVLLSARNLSEHVPKRSKHSKSLPFGKRRVAQKALDGTSVEGQLDPKEVGTRKRAAKQPMQNPYAKKKAAKKTSSNQSRAAASAPTTAPFVKAAGAVDNTVDADESELMEDLLDATTLVH